ncbi:MAG: alpha-amylase family glycosyl hydrolase [Chitinophagaceae bacterium]
MSYKPKKYVELKHPEWSKNATIYEVNTRQYTIEGTFTAFEAHLPRLKDMGIDIIWLMPVNTIGKKKRKGILGSSYSVSDYYSVNPEFGTKDDLILLVKKIHSMGMYVIIDGLQIIRLGITSLPKITPIGTLKLRKVILSPHPDAIGMTLLILIITTLPCAGT